MMCLWMVPPPPCRSDVIHPPLWHPQVWVPDYICWSIFQNQHLIIHLVLPCQQCPDLHHVKSSLQPLYQCLTCNADTHYNSYCMYGKQYLCVLLQILYLSNLYLAHSLNTSEKNSSLTSSMTVANIPHCVSSHSTIQSCVSTSGQWHGHPANFHYSTHQCWDEAYQSTLYFSPHSIL